MPRAAETSADPAGNPMPDAAVSDAVIAASVAGGRDAQRAIELSRETVRRRLRENQLKPCQQDMWCIPEVDGTYVARMEDVLDL